jgi:hypothetical protein
MASPTGFAAALWLRRTTADQRAWQDSACGDDVPAADDKAGTGPDDLAICNAIWDARTANRRNTRKENPKP